MAQRMTRGEVQDLLAKFATENPRYREALISDPKAIVEKTVEHVARFRTGEIGRRDRRHDSTSSFPTSPPKAN